MSEPPSPKRLKTGTENSSSRFFKPVKKIAVLGAGSYGTALAYVLAKYNRAEQVVLYCRNEKQAEAIRHEHINRKRFSQFKLPKNVDGSSNIEEAVQNASLIVLGIPTQHLPDFVEKNLKFFQDNVPLVSTAKGIHVKSHRLVSDALEEALGDRINSIPLAYLSGPSFAKEMMQGHPMALILASRKIETAVFCQNIMSCLHFRLYTSLDVTGVECGGAFKNPAAIGSGIAQGLGYGQSSIAGIVTRSCKEMRELTLALGGKPETLVGLSGFGDLMLTCFSSKSRNNRLGCMIAKGMTVEEACCEIGEVVEGVPTAAEIVRLADIHKLRLPLFRAVDAILSGKIKPSDGLKMINAKPPGEEDYI
eukprot:g9140.t1